jgi:hypothetical protein
MDWWIVNNYYELQHAQKNLSIMSPSFEGARRDYAYQWRDSDGSIPWRMFYVTHTGFREHSIYIEIDPWNGSVK